MNVCSPSHWVSMPLFCVCFPQRSVSMCHGLSLVFFFRLQKQQMSWDFTAHHRVKWLAFLYTASQCIRHMSGRDTAWLVDCGCMWLCGCLICCHIWQNLVAMNSQWGNKHAGTAVLWLAAVRKYQRFIMELNGYETNGTSLADFFGTNRPICFLGFYVNQSFVSHNPSCVQIMKLGHHQTAFVVLPWGAVSSALVPILEPSFTRYRTWEGKHSSQHNQIKTVRRFGCRKPRNLQQFLQSCSTGQGCGRAWHDLWILLEFAFMAEIVGILARLVSLSADDLLPRFAKDCSSCFPPRLWVPCGCRDSHWRCLLTAALGFQWRWKAQLVDSCMQFTLSLSLSSVHDMNLWI